MAWRDCSALRLLALDGQERELKRLQAKEDRFRITIEISRPELPSHSRLDLSYLKTDFRPGKDESGKFRRKTMENSDSMQADLQMQSTR